MTRLSRATKKSAIAHDTGQRLRSVYAALSMRDLLDARDQYHIHLMRDTNVVATAVGYYRIRKGDSWPGETPVIKGEGARNLANSELRPYSWPAVLVFVQDWIDGKDFGKGRKYDPSRMVPETLFLPDGRRVPVCVIEAPRNPQTAPGVPSVRYPLNNIGSGHPVLVEVQEEEHVATIACLATDGHKVYGLTNRHVTGEARQVIQSRLGGRPEPIGESAALQATRAPFSDIYPGWPGRTTYVNLDVGLIDITDLNLWTARLKDGTIMGPMVDLSSVDFPLSLVGRHVQGYGAASRWMLGEIHGLFYRYKSRGGFEYVADFFIGPRTPTLAETDPPKFFTLPGDSGTLWLLEPDLEDTQVDGAAASHELRPICIQWGANRLYSALTSDPQAYALATSLSAVCDTLDLDIVRDWNLDQPDTWGAVGHFAIASRVAAALSNQVPTLKELMNNNAEIISHDDNTILSSEFKRMGDDAIIPMADVPDFFWKHGKQGHTRAFEGPNHFADMDQKRSSDGVDLLSLCENADNIDPDTWNRFYDSVEDLLDGGPISPQHRGLLPFRVWEIFDEMVGFVKRNKMSEFVCAAGVLTHYVGDACQPLHISYLHDGDPDQSTVHTVHHHDGTTSNINIPLGAGVHSAYEDGMVNGHRKAILTGLNHTPKVTVAEHIGSGFGAAQKTIELMRDTFSKIDPGTIIQIYLTPGKKKAEIPNELWTAVGADTIKVMQNGVHLLAVLWESAWVLGGGEDKPRVTKRLDGQAAMDICAPADFLESFSVAEIGQHLIKPQ